MKSEPRVVAAGFLLHYKMCMLAAILESPVY
jgi:hypothetical protein